MKQAGCNEVDKSMNKMEEFNYTVEHLPTYSYFDIKCMDLKN